MIYVNALCKSYGEKQVFSNFNASFEEHKTTCLMGESGCGKTTLLRIMLGLEKADSGEVIGLEKKHMAAVFQEDLLCNDFDAITNVKLVLNKAITKQEIMNHFREVGLEVDSLSKPIKQLSGGMKRRVAIVRSIMADSDVIFMDEPMKGLDITTNNMVLEYIKRHTKNKTLFIVTHREEEVRDFEGTLIVIT